MASFRAPGPENVTPEQKAELAKLTVVEELVLSPILELETSQKFFVNKNPARAAPRYALRAGARTTPSAWRAGTARARAGARVSSAAAGSGHQL